MFTKAVSVAALACVAAAMAVSPAAARSPGPDSSPPPSCGDFLSGYTLTTAHNNCSLALSDAVVACVHDKDSTPSETYDDTDCFLRLGSLLAADCVSAQGNVSGAPYDATGCGLVVDGTLVLACSSEGGSPGPGQPTSRYSNCTSGPVSCSVTMYPDPRYGAPGSITPDCPPPVDRRR